MTETGNKGYIRLNGHKILCGPNCAAFEDMIASIIKNHRGYSIHLKYADENACLMVLQKYITCKYLDWHILEREKCSLTVYLDSCSLDERLFALLEQHWERPLTGVELIFRGDTRIQLKNVDSLPVLMKGFAGMGNLSLTLKAVDYREKHIYFKMGFYVPKDPEKLPSYAPPFSIPLSIDQESFPIVSWEETKDGKLASQAPLLLMVLSLPTVKYVDLQAPATLDLQRQAFAAFCMRPPNAMPCKYDHKMLTDSSLPQVLEHFNQAKITNLVLNMTPETVLDPPVLQRALDVLSRSVYLSALQLSINDKAQFENALYFMRELRKILPRMRPLWFYFSNNIKERSGVTDEAISLKEEIAAQCARGTHKERCAIMVMVVATTFNVARAGLHCLLNMLPMVIIKELFGFLI